MKTRFAIGILAVTIVFGIVFGLFVTSIKVTDIEPGQWGLSKIVEEEKGSFTTAALLQISKGELTGKSIQAFYPPMVDGQYPTLYALVRFVDITGVPDNDTFLFPTLDTRLGELASRERRDLINQINSKLADYTYTDYRGDKKSMGLGVKDKDDVDIRDIVIDIFEYLGHTKARARLAVFETHNTEYTDDFSTDPSGRWATESSVWTWDSINGDMDFTTGGDHAHRYINGSPGSVEHEAQITGAVGSTNTRGPGAGVRFDNTGVNDWYAFHYGGSNTWAIQRYVGGVRTGLASGATLTTADGDFVTNRLAAEGAIGANVFLSGWNQNHGVAKPSDPGWIGVDGSPNITYTDTAANRLDDAAHAQGGVANRLSTAYDPQADYFKVRAISDRGGVAAPTVSAIKVRGGVKVKGGVNLR